LKKSYSVQSEQIQKQPKIVNKTEDIKIFRTKFSAAFDSDSDTSEKETISLETKEEYPSIGNVNRKYENFVPSNSWARTTSKVPVPKVSVPKKVDAPQNKLSLIHPDNLSDEPIIYVPYVNTCKYDIHHDWADDAYWGSDSDEE